MVTFRKAFFVQISYRASLTRTSALTVFRDYLRACDINFRAHEESDFSLAQKFITGSTYEA